MITVNLVSIFRMILKTDHWVFLTLSLFLACLLSTHLHYRTLNSDEQVKPRSLRFTWSMKTTSSRDPNEIMAEIRKVSWAIWQETEKFTQVIHKTVLVMQLYIYVSTSSNRSRDSSNWNVIRVWKFWSKSLVMAECYVFSKKFPMR